MKRNVDIEDLQWRFISGRIHENRYKKMGIIKNIRFSGRNKHITNLRSGFQDNSILNI